MARRRFFVSQVRGGMAEVQGETAQHLRKVLRAAPGQRYELTDQQDVYLGEIEGFGKDLVRFRILERVPVMPPPVRLAALIALIKFDRFELAIEKATELGVDVIVPVLAERCDCGLERAAPKRLPRWRRIAQESAQQCRRLRAPEIRAVVPFPLALQVAASQKIFLDEDTGAPPLLGVLPPPQERSPETLVAILAGPEGGWTVGEREAARQQGWTPASLGPLILRTETATAAALALVSGAWQVCGSSVAGPENVPPPAVA